MKKKFLIFLSILTVFGTVNTVSSKSISTPELAEAIKTYKTGDYSRCYSMLENIVRTDGGNALAHYYMAITAAQIGKRDEALQHYDSAILLTPENNNLNRYAKKGKRCIETPDKCEESLYDSLEDEFIQKRFGNRFSEEVQNDYEKLKLENLMRDINRKDDIEYQRFKEYKDFSNIPTNDEVVAALKTLQKAGFGNLINNNYNDLSVLTGASQQNSVLNLMGNSTMNPQLIQALLTNNMTQGF